MSSRERRRRKKDSQEKPGTTPPEPPKGGGAFYIGGGSALYLDAWSNDARGGLTGDGAPAQISGRFDHTPVPGGSYTHVRYMGTGKYALPPYVPVAQPSATARRFSGTLPSTVPARSCACGFQAFTWQQTCPKCERSLKE